MKARSRARPECSSRCGSATRRRATGAAPRPSRKGSRRRRHYAYKIAGDGDFRPVSVYDDGRFTYFTFSETGRQPAIFKADAGGRERTVNWTQEGNMVRVSGVNTYWTLRLGEEALCIYRDTSVIYMSN